MMRVTATKQAWRSILPAESVNFATVATTSWQIPHPPMPHPGTSQSMPIWRGWQQLVWQVEFAHWIVVVDHYKILLYSLFYPVMSYYHHWVCTFA